MAGKEQHDARGERSFTELERQQYQALLKRLDRFAELMDSRLRIPGTGIRFGLDGLIGLIPIAGDAVSTILSLYLMAEARRIGAPRSVVNRMAANTGLDFLVGLVPVAGDLLDFAFKANLRNAALLRNYTLEQLQTVDEAPRRRSPLVWVLAGLGLVFLVLVIIAL